MSKIEEWCEYKTIKEFVEPMDAKTLNLYYQNWELVSVVQYQQAGVNIYHYTFKRIWQRILEE